MSRIYDALRRVRAGEALEAEQRNVETTAAKPPQTDTVLKWRIIGTFAGVIVLVGLLIVGSVYYFAGRALREQADQRAASLATTLSDAAAAPLMGRNVLELYALVRNYTLLDGVAYAFVSDSKGEIVAHTLGVFPPELREAAVQNPRETNRRQLNLQGNEIYETRVPIFDGQLGAAHIGIWGGAVEEQMKRALLPLFGVIGVILAIGVLCAILVGRRVSQLINS
jgi:sensor histidine kinase regulating citrate/malate metabolism